MEGHGPRGLGPRGAILLSEGSRGDVEVTEQTEYTTILLHAQVVQPIVFLFCFFFITLAVNIDKC